MKNSTHQVFNHETFYPAFQSDLGNAQHVVLIQSAFISIRQIDRIGPYIHSCSRRGVRVCAFLQEPVEWKSDRKSPRLKPFEGAIELLQSLGVHATLRRKVHEKVIAIDTDVLWEGSMNVLSHYDTSERMTRWKCEEKVKRALEMHGLHSCEMCLETQLHRLFAPTCTVETLQQVLGQHISTARKSRGLTQTELARRAQLDRKVISEVESGKKNFELKTLLRICVPLDLAPLVVPRHSVPVLGDIFRNPPKLGQPDISCFEPPTDNLGDVGFKDTGKVIRAKM